MHSPTLSRQGAFPTTLLAEAAAEGQWATAQAHTSAGDALLPVLADKHPQWNRVFVLARIGYHLATPLLLRLPA